MSHESDTKKVKKGFIYAVTDIGFNAEILETFIFEPKTISKIVLIINVGAGNSLQIEIAGNFSFLTHGEVSYSVYNNIFTTDETVEIAGGNFSKYLFNILTDGSTVGNVYIFFEYDYDLIK